MGLSSNIGNSVPLFSDRRPYEINLELVKGDEKLDLITLKHYEEEE